MEVNGQPGVMTTLTFGKEPLRLTSKEAGRPHSWSVCNGKEKNPYPCKESNPSHPPCSQSLYQLCCLCY